MRLHHAIIADLLREIETHHQRCAVVLIGSVAHGSERAHSDIDLNIFLPGDSDDGLASPFVSPDNRWQLSMKGKRDGVRIDIAWETYDGLSRRLEGDGPAECWPFANGKILRDPEGVVAPLLSVARSYFDSHPEVAGKLQEQYRAAKQKQADDRGQRA